MNPMAKASIKQVYQQMNVVVNVVVVLFSHYQRKKYKWRVKEKNYTYTVATNAEEENSLPTFCLWANSEEKMWVSDPTQTHDK